MPRLLVQRSREALRREDCRVRVLQRGGLSGLRHDRHRRADFASGQFRPAVAPSRAVAARSSGRAALPAASAAGSLAAQLDFRFHQTSLLAVRFRRPTPPSRSAAGRGSASASDERRFVASRSGVRRSGDSASADPRDFLPSSAANRATPVADSGDFMGGVSSTRTCSTACSPAAIAGAGNRLVPHASQPITSSEHSRILNQFSDMT